jgi:hypothetical protein
MAWGTLAVHGEDMPVLLKTLEPANYDLLQDARVTDLGGWGEREHHI